MNFLLNFKNYTISLLKSANIKRYKNVAIEYIFALKEKVHWLWF